MSKKNESVAQLGALLARIAPKSSPHVIGMAASLMLTAAKQCGRAAIRECNVGDDEHTDRWRRMAKAKMVKAFDLLGWPPGECTYTMRGDPRGYVVKLNGPTARANSNELGGDYGIG